MSPIAYGKAALFDNNVGYILIYISLVSKFIYMLVFIMQIFYFESLSLGIK